MKNKKLFKSFKLLVVSGTLVLSMGGCAVSKVKLESKKVLSITPTKVYNEYLEQYKEGTVSVQPSVLDLKEYLDRYDELRDTSTDTDSRTLGFDFKMIKYDSKKEDWNKTSYYYKNELVKKIGTSDIYFKIDDYDVKMTSNGCSIKLGDRGVGLWFDNDENYDVNCFNSDKMYSYEFSSSGSLVGSRFNDNYYSYKNGNPNFYSIYRDDDLICEKLLDGGYTRYEYNSCIDKKYLTASAFNYLENKGFNSIAYSYDSSSNLMNIKAINDNMSCTIFSDKRCNVHYENYEYDLYSYYNSDNSYKDVKISKDDSRQLRISYFNRSGDLVSRYFNGVLVENFENDIRYFYNYDGTLNYSKQYVDDGVLYYNSDGIKEYMEDLKGNKKISYNPDGSVDTVFGDKIVSYYDYDNNIIKSTYENNIETKYYENQNVERIDNFSDKEYTSGDYILEKNGYIEFYENGGVKAIKNGNLYKSYYENGNLFKDYVGDDGIIYYESGNKMSVTRDNIVKNFDEIGNITSISKDGVSTSYYDYNSNLIKSITSDGIMIEYHQNQTISSVININSDTYQYGEYTLNKGDSIRYYDDGVIQMEWIDGKRVDYNHDGSISSITEGDKTIGYYDYSINNISYCIEKNITIRYFKDGNISSINNNSDDAFICDLYGTHYELKSGESVYFHENHNLSKIVQDGIFMSYYSTGAFSGVENYREKPYIFTYANQDFEVLKGDNIYFYGDGNICSRKQGDITISYFEDGTVKSSNDGVRITTFYSMKDKNLFSIRENGVTTFYYGDNVLYSTNNNITGYGSSGSNDELYSFSITDNGEDIQIYHR